MQNTPEKVEEIPYSTNKYINLACCVLENTIVAVFFVPVMTIHLLIYVIGIPGRVLSMLMNDIEVAIAVHTGFAFNSG